MQRFEPGQEVRFVRRTRSVASGLQGSYAVVRAQPVERDEELRYRLKNSTEAYERIARESELELCDLAGT